MKVKYIRWSTLMQSADRQKLDSENYDLVLAEQVSGAVTFVNRPKGNELLKLIKQGKVKELYVEELSRIGRDTIDILTTLKVCEEYKVNVHLLNMNINSIMDGKSNPIFKMFTQIIAALAEQEREAIRERTEQGKLAARLRGVTFGRKVGSNERKIDFLNKEKNRRILKYLQSEKYSIREIGKLTNSATATIQKVKKIGLEVNALNI